MKQIILSFTLLSGFLASCSSPDYFIKEAKKKSPHAILALPSGATQVVKIDDKFPPEGGGATVRLTPGKHTLTVESQGQQTSLLGGLLGTSGQEVSSQAVMQVDLAPGNYYRPDATLNAAGTYFFLRDENGIRSASTRSYTSSY